MEPTAQSISRKERHINVNEIFGPTIQGEGIHSGVRVAFLRLAGCNLSCVWCDTPYSWDWSRYDRNEESHKRTITEVAEELKAMHCSRLILTGGEPMMQQWAFADLQAATGMKIDVETNGTRMPTADAEAAIDMFCVSPKLGHAGDPKERRIVIPALRRFAQLADEGKAMFKFVAKTEADFEEIEEVIKLANIDDHAVWIMPEGANPTDHMQTTQNLADAVVKRGWNLSMRLHLLIWNTERKH